MRRVTGSIAVAALTLLGGCAHPTPPQDAALAAPHRRPVSQRGDVVPCSTTHLVIATVATCGAGSYPFGVAAE